MTKCTPSLFFVSFMLAFALHAAPAQAQSRVFVAAQGSDANPCTFSLPCRTFQHAHDVVAANGEIDVLDPAGYGALTITKSISIQGHGFAGISAASGNGITINGGANDNVSLRGLLLDGVGSGNNGIRFNTGLSLDVQECLIRNFTGSAGLLFTPSNASQLFVSNSHFAVNNVGVDISGPSSSGVLDHVGIEKSQLQGLHLGSGFSLGGLTVSDSIIAGNGGGGVLVSNPPAACPQPPDCPPTPPPSTILLRNLTVSGNVGEGLAVLGSHAWITKSTFTGNVTGLSTTAGGQIISFGDNSVVNNVTNGAPTSTIALQ